MARVKKKPLIILKTITPIAAARVLYPSSSAKHAHNASRHNTITTPEGTAKPVSAA
ncbi:hypothetical protein AAIR98_000133 [Elusimicrobium simillimum]|uniref:hypothetical protein n=1 Tax=Elusimicrobium simillimum TaxID=3143438 RepID=UPI003C70127D